MPSSDPIDGATLPAGLVSGDRRALARSISTIESGALTYEDPTANPFAGKAFVVGITGPPGAGKSTLVARLTDSITAAGLTAAILLIDPSSPVTGGAILGDRVRFASTTGGSGHYVRSMASRGQGGGTAVALAPVLQLLARAPFDLVVVETVGAGQSDYEISKLADVTVCVCPPGLGDSMQAMKAGILEVADVFVVSKSDQPGATSLAADLRSITNGHNGVRRPIFLTSSISTDDGVDQLWSELDRRRNEFKPSREVKDLIEEEFQFPKSHHGSGRPVSPS